MSDFEQFHVRLLPNTGEGNSTVFILGPTGSGKTTLLANLLRQRERFIVIDSKKDYSAQYFGQDVIEVSDVNHLLGALNGGVERIIFALYEVQSEYKAETLSMAMLVCFEFQLQNPQLPPLTIALDELDAYVTSKGAPPGIKKIIEMGRSVRIHKIFGGQWFADIPSWARDTFSEIYAFAHHDINGLARLNQFGFDPEIVRDLAPFTCCYVGQGKTRLLRLIASEA